MLLPQRHRTVLALAIAIALGYAGNYFSLALFFGVDFIFGSIAVLLVVRFFGAGWGVLAAAIASTHTVVLWNHPYAIIIYICEALFVGLLWQRQRQNFVLIDAIYWLCFGIPLVWLFYFKCMQIDTTLAWLVVLKYSVNGIFNVLVASLLATYLPLHKWVRPQFVSKPALRQILIALLLPCVFLPALLLILLDCRMALVHIEKEIQTELHSVSNNLISNLHNRYQEYLRAISQLGEVAALAGMTPSPRLLQSMELIHQIYPDMLTIRALDTTGYVLAAYPPLKPTLSSSLASDERSLFQATKTNLEPAIGNVHIHPDLNISHADLSVPVFAEARFVGSMYVELNFDSINEFLRSQLPPRVQQITLLDAENKTVFTTDPQRAIATSFHSHSSRLRSLNDGIYLWLPPKGQLPTMVRWQQSFYVKEILLNDPPGWKLILAIPAKSYIKFLYYAYINDFAFMLVAAVLAIICGMLLSHHLTKPLSQLAQVTTNLPHKLLEREKIVWPNSPVIEINSLIHNFKLMAIALNEKFHQVQATNQKLKLQIKERTKKLAQTNKELANEINEHQQTDVALRESEERYRDLFENANDLIHSVTSNGNFLYVNRAWRETLGYSEAEISAMRVFNIIHPELLAQFTEIFQRVIAGQKIEHFETAFITKDGRTIWIEGSANCKFVDGKPIATRAIFRDITERKQAEAEISYALEKERQLIEIKHRFITTASHEFRTPLTVILMSAKLLEQFGREASEEKKSLYLDRIQAATKRMTQLLDDLLLIGKAEAGKLKFTPATLQIEKFCREIVAEMHIIANGNHSISLEYQEQDTVVELDEKLLRYILSNLLSNAIKYSPKGGIITFRLTVNCEQVVFEIQDRGIGIPAADREHLFKSFHRGSNVESISGTGLGMSIVKQCVDLHGGEITVNSEVGVGTTFIVILPLNK